MKFNLLFTIASACMLMIMACQPTAEAPADMAQIKTEIQALETAWGDALTARDLEALMALYADDAVSMPDNEPIMVGKEAIRKQQEQEFANTPEGMTYSFEVLDVYGDGNTVTEIGKSTYTDASGKVTGTGKFIAVWEKQDDKYLCIREIYNGDAPSAPAATKSIHLFDLPTDVTEAEWLASLNEMNTIVAGIGYPGAGYYMYKTENDADKNYRYYFEGVWPSAEAYTKIHEDPTWIAASEKSGAMYDKIKTMEIYRRMNRVK